MDLTTLLFSLLALLVAGYAILDGFDLGVGILSVFAQSQEERDRLIASIGPVWDGNQVWLLTTANLLFGAFPYVFTTVLSGFYLIFMMLLIALVARAVSMEFRLMHRSPGWFKFWDQTLAVSSFYAAFLLGMTCGHLVHGLPIGEGFQWEEASFELTDPYALLIGMVSCAMFAMHGAVYLWMKSGEEASQRRLTALRTCQIFLPLFGIGLIATATVSPHLFEHTPDMVFWAFSFFLATALASLLYTIRAGMKLPAFIGSSASIALMIFTTASSSYPVLIPSSLNPAHSLTIHNASSTPGTLLVMLVIALCGIPIMLCYTFAIYRVFRVPARSEK